MKIRYFLIVLWLCVTTTVHAQDWMPDPALRAAVREELGRPLTQDNVKLHLTGINALNRGISDLTGLEHATDLQVLWVQGNNIQNLSPLSGLIGLVSLNVSGNQIKDISPLSGLVNLKELHLNDNPISDLSPLVGLENLEDLRVRYINGIDRLLSMIPLSKVLQFGYTETCDLERTPSISERLANRDFPSVFAAWGNIINIPSLGWHDLMPYHDYYKSGQAFQLRWLSTPEGTRTYLHVETARKEREELLSLNPNMLFIVTSNFGAANPGEYPDDWPYWVRDESGNIVYTGVDHPLIDFTYPEYQDYVVRQAVMFAQCGLYDGIFFDWWADEWKHREDPIFHHYAHDVHEAAINILRRVREAVGDEFLIVVNSGKSKVPRSAPYINGMFMETIGGYDHQGLAEIESTLLWGEQHLREPKVNTLEGWSKYLDELLDSPSNQQWMRLFTTMSLTHSDGFVLYSAGNDFHHNHYWYDFYDAPLGRPIGGDESKGIFYENPKGEVIEGMFIREFTGGWAVYNRSGKQRRVYLPEKGTGVASGVENKHWHTLGDLDGEIYLKSVAVPEDVNADGTVNILDLVQVANGFNGAAPDLNGDGIVNILDLVLVSQRMGESEK